MIVKNKTNPIIEEHKKKLHLKGDVYVVDNHIASLASHKAAYPQSKATTIEEAEAEFRKFQIIELARRIEASEEKPEEIS